MNLFFTNRNPQICAQDHCDKHVVKMILEYAQLLSTAHRLLDGKHKIGLSPGGNKQQQWDHPEPNLYKASHVNHPDAVWCRANSAQYRFLYDLFAALCDEYTLRYGKVHATDVKLRAFLSNAPGNIQPGVMTDPPLSMPDEYKADDAVTSYQNLYVGGKARFAVWTNRKPPEWFIQRTPDYNESNFERTRGVAARTR